MDQINEPGFDRNSVHRNSPVVCPSCGRQTRRRMRRQRYCSKRCRQKAHYAQKVDRGDFSTRTIALPTTPHKKDNKLKALQRAKIQSSYRILAPARVLHVELFNRPWRPAISSDGVGVEISRIRPRALVGSLS
jgi:endogenous inhibitor of DNA gyrase (YacG/DUF329 family)